MERTLKSDTWQSRPLPAPDLDAFLRFAPGAFLLLRPDDPVFTIIGASEAYMQLSGVARKDLIGRGVFAVFPDNPDLAGANGVANLLSSLRRAIDTARPDRMPLQRYDIERPKPETGFEEHYWSTLNSPVVNAGGGIDFLIHSVEEVTSRVRAEQRELLVLRNLQTSEKRFRQLAESSAFGLVIADLEGGLSYLNRRAQELLGYTEQEVAAGLVRWDRITPPGFAAVDAEAIRQLRTTGACAPFEKAYIAKDGRYVPVLVAPSILETASGRAEVAAFIVDLTERNNSERDAFLLQLDDAIHLLADPDEIMSAVCRLLGDRLQVDRCAYCAFDPDEETLVISVEYRSPDVPSMSGRYSLTQFGTEAARSLRSNLPYAVDDVGTDPRTAAVRDAYRAVGVLASAVVPLQKAGRLAAALGIHQRTPRRWQPAELELLHLVAARCWETIERARVTLALRHSEQRLRLSQRAGRIGSFEWLMKDDKVIWSPELEALFGLPEGTFEGRLEDWSSRVVAEDGDRVLAGVRDCLARKQAEYDYEFRAILPHGGLLWLGGQAQFFYDETGAPELMVGVNIDIHARKQAEALLRESECRLRAIYDGTSGYIGLLATDGTLLETNRASLEFAGNTREEVVGLPFWETPWFTATPGAPDAIRQAVSRAGTGEFIRFEAALRRPSGEPTVFDVAFHPVLNERGETVLIVPEGRNITEQKQAEERLRQQWQLFDAALSNSPDFAYTLDLQGRFTYANRALLSLLQLRLEDLIGKNFFDLQYPDELASRLQRQIAHVIETRRPVRDNTPFTGPSGETRFYEYIFVPVPGSDGSVDAVAGSTRDITERKQAEEQERDREERLRESARLESLGIMAGGIAHDFNNLLTGILGNASLLAENQFDVDYSLAGEIILAAERAADLTKQMLAFSGKGHFVIELLDLNALVQENLTLLRATLSRSISVELELCPQPCLVEADRAQIQQVVMNILINASEAIGERPGKVVLRTALAARDAARFSERLHAMVRPGKYVLLEVRDDGCGMQPETLKRIFDPFFTTKFTGRGLGLAAVLGIVKGHKGDLEVESRPGAGTTFRVLLPASDRTIQTRASRPVATVRAAGQSVLVVDDEEIVRKIAQVALQSRGFRVFLASDGLEALDVLRQEPSISLVILDLTMPVMTGEQAIPLIQALRPDTPVILSSGFAESEISQRFASFGIAGVLQKPYTVAAIISKVHQALQHSVPLP